MTIVIESKIPWCEKHTRGSVKFTQGRCVFNTQGHGVKNTPILLLYTKY